VLSQCACVGASPLGRANRRDAFDSCCAADGQHFAAVQETIATRAYGTRTGGRVSGGVWGYCVWQLDCGSAASGPAFSVGRGMATAIDARLRNESASGLSTWELRA